MSNNKEIKELELIAAREVKADMEVASELGLLKDKLSQMEQAFASVKSQSQQFSQNQSQQQQQPQAQPQAQAQAQPTSSSATAIKSISSTHDSI